jgi:hypothetical protein
VVAFAISLLHMVVDQLPTEKNGRNTVEIQIRIEEVGLIEPALLELKLPPPLLVQEELLPLLRLRRHALLLPHLGPGTVPSLLNHILMHRRRDLPGPRPCHLLPYPHNVQTRQRGPVQIRPVGIDVAVQARVDGPLDDLQRGVEARRQAVADRVVEVVAEDEGVAGDGPLGVEGEGDAVLVVLVLLVGEVGVGGRGSFRKACVRMLGGDGPATRGYGGGELGSTSVILDADVQVDGGVFVVDVD